jgi:hypothetical protein
MISLSSCIYIRDLTLGFPFLPQNKMAFTVCLYSVLEFIILLINI